MIKKTVSKNLLLRLSAQADEAEIYGNTKVASALTDTIVRLAEDEAIRESDEGYEYKSKELIEDIRVLVWSAAMRVFDYYENLPDARIIDDVVEDLTDTVVSAFENLVEGTDKGKYEPEVPGESEEAKNDTVEEDEITWKVSLPESSGHEMFIQDEESDEEEKEEEEMIEEDEDEEEYKKEIE